MPAACRDGVWFGRSAILTGDGREVPVSQVILAHRNAQGELTQLSTIARDVSEFERMQSERQALQAQLQESQKLEALGTLAGGVAHDFNNVLAAILGNIGIARQDAARDAPVLASLQRIEQAATRARTLVQQILAFSRRTLPSDTAHALRPALEDALSLLHAALPPSARLPQSLSAEPMAVRLDGAQVQQVVLNLCANACLALPDQTGTITLRLDRVDFQPGDARPPPLRDGPHAHLQVQDDGIGMDDATRARVLEPFFTTKPVGQGTGLGLAVVHGIVNGCGGAIVVASRPGQGTCFDIDLPLAADALVASAGESPPRGAEDLPPVPGHHLLYGDDDEVVALPTRSSSSGAASR